MKKWLDPQPVSVPDDLMAEVGGHLIVAETLARRGIIQPQAARRFLDPTHYSPTSSDALPDMDKAVDRIARAIRQRETILIWGDFDVDGQTSTALLVAALRDLGATVRYHIPNRFSEGHGIHLPTLKTLLDGGVDVVLTCDTGIAAHEAIDYAQGRGVDVVITDHHSLPQTLPTAYAAVNPMRLPEGHPLRELPGVGTAYKFVQGLYGNQSTEHLLDLVAMGIVADVMVQVDDTRYLLQKGLDVLRNDPRPGLRAMMERANIAPATLTEMDIGFTLGPRLNALGRLADANPAVDLLTATDADIIAERVNELEGLNQKRRFLTRQVYEAAQQQIQDDPALLKYAALVIHGEGWHTGVVGIVASRLVEDYACPVIVLAENEGRLSGSARSVNGANIVQAIGKQAHLLNGYGGHNMAAGLSLDADNLFAFRRGLSQTVREMLGRETITPELAIDAVVDFNDIDLAFADDLSRLAPFGNGNPPLTLATHNVHVKSRRTMGSRGDHVDLRLEDQEGHVQRVVWWFGDLEDIPQGQFDIAYTVRANTFQGKREALVEWLDARPSENAITLDTGPRYSIIDHRQPDAPIERLQQLQADYPDALVYYEGLSRDVQGTDRYHLTNADTLIVWSVPPGAILWKALLNEVQPQIVILVGAQQPLSRFQDLVQIIAGLAKYAINQRQGFITMQDIAARTGQYEHTIQRAIHWLNAQSELSFEAVSEDSYVVTTKGAKANEPYDATRLKHLLDESRAYAAYWMKQSYD
ncbi:single-stranded-DNA-specific exonuclease RecJ [Phototrophicus methaneseepsis]|uniref:Single-stranded-DNA-specific exonuclease RecJ n=1 Tax=Phototrophicus methaneseepsis TaxID=2710758 RepID=A0A7S8EBW7_9CHLR|nr:single-stranded-DNA-specific exonuclease RecJ [Phototrophicus methaneseepsis]QPC84004.1 single-stranded-DNA-specific exonuclease RecJ [Phototrophicus methaneseepsis]